MRLDLSFYKTDIARKLAEIVNILLAVLGRTRDWSPHNPLVPIAFARLRRMVKRLERLVTLWREGKLRPPRQRAPRPRPASEPADPQPLRVPSRNGWVQAALPSSHQICVFITALASDPEVIALVAAAPQAGRILRPLCRMFGADMPEYLLLPKRPRKKPAPKPAPRPQAYPFPGVPRRWQTRIPGINAPKLKNA